MYKYTDMATTCRGFTSLCACKCVFERVRARACVCERTSGRSTFHFSNSSCWMFSSSVEDACHFNNTFAKLYIA